MTLEDKYELCLDFVKSFEKRAWDAWKPVQVFRSNQQVEIDEIKHELLDSINDEAKSIIEQMELK